MVRKAVRVGRKIIRQPEQPQKQKLFESRVKKEQERVQKQAEIKQLKGIASNLDKEFRKSNFSTVKEAKQELMKIKEQNPKVFQFMAVKPETFEQEQNQRINTLDKQIKELDEDIDRSRDKESRYKKEDRDDRADREDARQDGYRAEKRELEKFRKELQQGKIYNTKNILDFAYDVGKAKRKNEEIKNKNRKLQELQNKKIKEAEKDIKNIVAKVEMGQLLSTSDFVKAKELGIKKTELLRFADDTQKYNNALEKARAEEKKQRANFENKLGAFSKVLNPKQKDILYKSQFVSTTPYLQLPNKIKSEFKRIEKLPIEDFNKEKLKREALGQTVTNLGENLDLFGQTLSQAQLQSQIRKTTQKSIRDSLKKIKLSPEEKLRTGQTITPKQKQEVLVNIRSKNQFLENKQKDIAKDIFTAPTKYGINLRKRYDKGENNPLFNDLRGIGIGFLKEVGDTINFITGVKGITINSKGETYDGLIAKPARKIIDYGISLFNSADKQGIKTKLKEDIKKGSKAYAKGIGKTLDVTEFAFKNPGLSALIVGGAISQGVISSKKAYLKNPQENLGRAIVWLFPGTIIKGLKKVSKFDKIIEPVQKYSKNTFRAKQDLVTGKLRIVGESNGVFSNGKKFKTDYFINFNPKTKKYQVTAKTKVGKETITETFDLIEKAGFYVNPKTGEKVVKIRSRIDSQSIKIKEQKIKPIKEKVTIVNGEAFKTSQANIQTVLTKITDNVKKITNKVSDVSITISDKQKNVVLGLGKQFLKDVKKKGTSITKGLSQEQINQLEKFLKSIQYDEKLLAGLDKRTRLARALGLRKESNLLKSIETLIDKNGKVKKVYSKSGNIAVTGSFEKGIKPKTLDDIIDKIPNFNPKTASLRKNKKGSYNIGGLDEVTVLTQKTNKALPNKKVFNIPEIKAKLPLNKKNIKIYGIGGEISKAVRLLDKLIKNSRKVQNLKENERLLKQIQKEIGKIREKIVLTEKVVLKVPKKITLKKTKSVPRLRKTNIQKQKTQKVPRKPIRVKVPRITLKTRIPPKAPPRIPKLDLNFDSPKLKNKIVEFEAVFRERKNKNKPFNKRNNPIITKRIKKKTTKNRMIKEVADRVDKSLARSIEVKPIRITDRKKKDIKRPDILKKFDSKKSKNTPVLKLVEKTKYLLDTKAEKKEAKKIRRIKKKTKKSKNTKKKSKQIKKKTTKKSKK